MTENFPVESYQSALMEIRERLISADILSKQHNVVFIESTALQIRKILELIAYLSILVNSEKLNHKEKNEWRAQKIIETLASKTTIFYPLPSRVIAPQEKESEPTLIPLATRYALSQSDFVDAYSNCGKILHAQHPFKDELDFRQYFAANRQVLSKIRHLLQNHVIAIRHDHNKYTFLSVEFDFTNNEDTRSTIIREYKSHIFDEIRLKNLFEKFWRNT
jgi:hypothetical protein